MGQVPGGCDSSGVFGDIIAQLAWWGGKTLQTIMVICKDVTKLDVGK